MAVDEKSEVFKIIIVTDDEKCVIKVLKLSSSGAANTHFKELYLSFTDTTTRMIHMDIKPPNDMLDNSERKVDISLRAESYVSPAGVLPNFVTSRRWPRAST
ncbi:unnamed protein product [Protopolystoma xenopodis]|uniref:Uncharacterized protein n=1 Tax=Protopolystoma xenopodis TaxID=117903 RepID=A0A448WDE0_9PLAT|nr:unnamed protein product [Protopolystoma xenopodis]